MKKVFYSFAVVAAFALVSCGGNKANEEAAEVEATETEVVTEANDSTVTECNGCENDSTCTETPCENAEATETPAEA